MTRRSRGSRRTSRPVRLYGTERLLFIIGSATYFIGLLGGMGLLGMPASTAVILLSVGGGLLFAVGLSIVF